MELAESKLAEHTRGFKIPSATIGIMLSETQAD